MNKILAIDDKADNLVTVSALIRNLLPGTEVIAVQSGREGIAAAERELPDVIILDVKMPEMDGFEVCRLLKSNDATKHIPIILLTAIKTDVPSRIHGLELGADAFLTKPIDETELVAQINVMLRIKHTEDLLRMEKELLEVMVEERTEALTKERDFIKSLEDASPAYYVALGPEGGVMTMNRAMLAALGTVNDRARGLDFFEGFVHEQDREMARRAFSLMMENRKTPTVEFGLVAEDGRDLLVEWQGRPFYAKGGALEFVFFVGIDITERKRLEKIIMNDSEKERNRIGQNLHDGLGQHLAGIAFKSEILKLKLRERSAESNEDVDEIIMLVNQAIDQARDLAKGLCPVDMSAGGLRSALEDLRNNTSRLFGVNCLLDWDEMVSIEGDMEGSHLYYIAKEAVNNAVRHGKARNILISMGLMEGSAAMRITDDGIGIPENTDEAIGMGLKIMRYRAWIIGSSFEAKRSPGGGTEVACVIRGAAWKEDGALPEDLKMRFLSERNDHRARILVVDDHPIVRQGLVQIINREEDLFVCGEARSAEEAIRLVSRLEPDMLTVDISLEGSSGLDLIKAMKSRYQGLPVLVLSIHDESIYAERAVRAGARGYIMKQEAPQTVVSAIRTVLSGGQYLSDNLKKTLLNRDFFGEPSGRAAPEEVLTHREFEIFQLIGQGLGNRHIADRLNISVKTVENIRDKIKNKLNIESASDVARFAIQWTIEKTKPEGKGN
ncbi:MAG: response regulator [Spirochaetes bacterium]|jgi:PAS domain S-box-containing protein|nr:response regulator [Spirochaetota bacterium]